MKCLVAVKRVIDFNVKVRVKTDNSGVETEHVKMSMNPFDEIALEEATRLKEAGIIKEVIAVSVGQLAAQETLRVALARGADKAILVETDKTLEPLNIAKILKYFVKHEKPDLIFLGKQAIDDDCNQTGQMLAALLDWPQGTNVSQIRFNQEDNQENKTMTVVREVDGGLETLLLNLPAVITVDLQLNEPRYISLPNVMRAKTKPLEIILLQDLNIDVKDHLSIIKVEAPQVHRQGVLLNSVEELVQKLHHDARVI